MDFLYGLGYFFWLVFILPVLETLPVVIPLTALVTYIVYRQLKKEQHIIDLENMNGGGI